MQFPGLKPDDLYLPARGVDLRRWAVVACDQYTSQPDYWQRVEAYVGEAPSTLHLVQPEIDLAHAEARIPAIHRAMREYLSNGMLVRAVHDGFTLTERATASGVRLGLVAAVDLEAYDFTPGSGAMIRATEGTIRERIPPRMRIREGAPLECPHVMLLLDDPDFTVIEPLYARLHETAPLCDFELMENGGHLRVWGVQDDDALAPVSNALSALWEKANGLLYAVGDGNHSLATAKACWDALKPTLSPEARQTHPARYALAEIVNLHSPALTFEPIHRVLFGTDVHDLLQSYQQFLSAHGMSLTPAASPSDVPSGKQPPAAAQPSPATCERSVIAVSSFSTICEKQSPAGTQSSSTICEKQSSADALPSPATHERQMPADVQPSPVPSGKQPPAAAQPSSAACEAQASNRDHLTFISANTCIDVRVENPSTPLPVAILQPFLDDYLRTHPAARIDYVHGASAVRALCQSPHTTGSLLPAIDKAALFPAVRQGGVLPRKTFSLGEADEKRYYMECRKIL